MFFESMIQLVAGKNKEGYLSTLLEVFRQHKLSVPSKAAFCKFRKRVSWTFFRDLTFLFLNRIKDERNKFHGFYVYATDGFETEIPRSENVLKAGFSGRSTGTVRQTYYPRLYMVHTWDVVNGITRDIILQTRNEEIRAALEIIPSLKKKLDFALRQALLLSQTFKRTHECWKLLYSPM